MHLHVCLDQDIQGGLRRGLRAGRGLLGLALRGRGGLRALFQLPPTVRPLPEVAVLSPLSAGSADAPHPLLTARNTLASSQECYGGMHSSRTPAGRLVQCLSTRYALLH